MSERQAGSQSAPCGVRQADSIPSETDVMLNEVNFAMRIEGACALQAYLDKSEEVSGISLEALAAIVYSRMRRMALRSQVRQDSEGQS